MSKIESLTTTSLSFVKAGLLKTASLSYLPFHIRKEKLSSVQPKAKTPQYLNCALIFLGETQATESWLYVSLRHYKSLFVNLSILYLNSSFEQQHVNI